MSGMYRKFIKIAEDSGACGLCKRDFASDSEEDIFIASVMDLTYRLTKD